MESIVCQRVYIYEEDCSECLYDKLLTIAHYHYITMKFSTIFHESNSTDES